jgi:hypothetical protein
MAKLKAGTAATETGFTNSMAAEIEKALKSEWLAVNGEEMPPNPRPQDSRILFAAIAQGVLNYLKAHKNDISTDTRNDTVSGHNHTLNFDVETG